MTDNKLDVHGRVIGFLILCALRKNGYAGAGTIWGRQRIYDAVETGLAEPISEVYAERIRTKEKRVIVRARLTEQGQAYIAALNPDDFKEVAWFPRPGDVRNAIERIKSGQYPKPKGKRK